MASRSVLVDLAMSGNAKVTGLPAATATGHALEYDQAQTALAAKQPLDADLTQVAEFGFADLLAFAAANG